MIDECDFHCLRADFGFLDGRRAASELLDLLSEAERARTCMGAFERG